MHVLIVHAHHEPKSFSGALTRRAVTTLTDLGHSVEVSDLYAMKFSAVADADDYTEREDPEYLRIDREQTHAHAAAAAAAAAAAVAADVRAEHDKIMRADLVILQYPMWWFSMPAILKGWPVRVFTRGYACLPGRKYDTGMLRGKLALVSVTTGTSSDTYAPDGIDGALLNVLWPVHNGLLRYSGFDVLTPFATHTPGKLTPEERTHALARYDAHLRAIDALPRLHFHPRGITDPTNGFCRTSLRAPAFNIAVGRKTTRRDRVTVPGRSPLIGEERGVLVGPRRAPEVSSVWASSRPKHPGRRPYRVSGPQSMGARPDVVRRTRT